MGYYPSAELCYGVSLMTKDENASISEEKLSELMDEDLGEFTIYSCGQDYHFNGYILAIKHEKDYFEVANPLGKTLPLNDASWDAKLKAFCEENKIPFQDPQWWLLASYG